MVHLIALVFILFLSSSGWGSVAKITALSGSASIERLSKLSPATLGIALEANDVVSTDENSKVQITFKDSTVITVGKKSRFSIDEYLFDSGDGSSAKFNVLAGTIRVMSGKIGQIAPEKFTVKTKTATIGIRGTNFTVDMESDGILSIFCLQGVVDVSDRNNNTASVPAGSYIPFSAEGIMGSLREFVTEDLRVFLEKSFYIPELVDRLKKNLTLPALANNLEKTFHISTIFSYTFDETAPPLIAAEKSGGILNWDESFDQGNQENMQDILTDSAMSMTTNILLDQELQPNIRP
ncbi:MAG: FecR family protein [Campylobacterales bacterium]|nr:FecR family protein [Campylobacterales bacterium]